MFCLNCGKYGHHNRSCRFPVTSYGVILFHPSPTGEIKYLMVQRKYSPFYIELVRGKYELTDEASGRVSPLETDSRQAGPPIPDRFGSPAEAPGLTSSWGSPPSQAGSPRERRSAWMEGAGLEAPRHLSYLRTLVEGLTANEREWLLELPFEQLWKNLWCHPSSQSHLVDYQLAAEKFAHIRHETDLLQRLIEETPSRWAEPEWGFPKGKREPRESDLNCATREFSEETGISSSDFYILSDIKPIQEVYTADNGITYRHIYYVAMASRALPVYISPFNRTLTSEIRKIAWCSLEQALARLRPYHDAKANILRTLEEALRRHGTQIQKAREQLLRRHEQHPAIEREPSS